MFRTMKKAEDGLPLVEDSKNGLGVVSDSRHRDLTVDEHGLVHPNAGGMSAACHWRRLPVHRIPKRLRGMVPGARGNNEVHCFRMGAGAFASGPLSEDLFFRTDSDCHGTLQPSRTMPVPNFINALVETRHAWVVDESM